MIYAETIKSIIKPSDIYKEHHYNYKLVTNLDETDGIFVDGDETYQVIDFRIPGPGELYVTTCFDHHATSGHPRVLIGTKVSLDYPRFIVKRITKNKFWE